MLRRALTRVPFSRMRSLTQEQLIEKYKLDVNQKYLLDYVSNHHPVVRLGDLRPLACQDSFIAPNATIVGNVEVWDFASVWYNCVIRGDVKGVRIRNRSNIQDGTVITEARAPLDHYFHGSTVIGHHVTVGHSCRLHACTIENECFVGMGSILHEGSYMEKGSKLGARTVLLPGVRVPSGQLWVGNPGRYVRDLTDAEMEEILDSSIRYKRLAEQHKEEFFLDTPMDLYLEAERLGIKVGWSDDEIYAKDMVGYGARDNSHQPHVEGRTGGELRDKGSL